MTEAAAWELMPVAPPEPHTIFLKSRQFQPGRANAAALDSLAPPQAGRVHLLVQLDYIPRQQAKAALEAQGLRLLAYVPDYAWIASYSAAGTSAILDLPGVTWAGALLPEDKLDPTILAGVWSEFNLKADGTAAVYVVMHLDESLEKGRSLVERYGGKVTGQAVGINLLMAEMPLTQVQALAGEDAVQWIEPAAPPLDEVNDGIRTQIGADTINAVPYSLDGSGIDVLVYDSGQVGDHPDFSGRLTHGDADTVSDHSTHVAGTLGGSGSMSASAGGSALQWRGMAPGVDIISYGTTFTYDYIFYNDVGDIEADWAAAQNTHGADMGTASLGMNIYANYPSRCDLMGNYGATSVLMDQIVRGGNSTVGIGDRYIATWAAGNERGSSTSCGTYSTTAEPATAKNLIQVGATNTNDNSMTTFSSWGPTDDGRLKPIIVAGGEQVGGDGGIKSTIPDLYINNSIRDCDGTGDDYCYPYDVMQGTSMATPAVAGGVAMMLQHYRDVFNTSGNFWPSTAKAILMQTADDLGNPGPDYQFGYGQVNLPRAVDVITRHAFRQDSVAAGAVDVFSLPVVNSSTPLAVSLAWDDFEATFNASVALINNLDLELVSPSGTLYRPWVLNPANPANNATRGVDNRNNQEQVTVTNPEVGTWLVRVRGTTVPQSPQSYLLACEGCQPLNLGVCQSQVSGTTSAQAQANPALDENPSASQAAPEEALQQSWLPPSALSRGELWQRSLESAAQPPDNLALELARLDAARRDGAIAVLALAETLSPIARDQAEEDLRQAAEVLYAQRPPIPPGAWMSEAEETALSEAGVSLAAANRLLAMTNFTDPLENQNAAPPPAETSPNVPAVDRTVGNGCTYATIAAAVAASAPGDRLLLEGNRTFYENVNINKNLTIEGGYNGCASGSTANTTIDGNGANSVLIINQGLTVTLRNLNVVNGYTGFEGGGIRFAIGGMGGSLTIENVNVYNNRAQWGGGIWVGPNATLQADALNVHNNTANDYGGGLRLYGGQVSLSNSNVYENSAPLGGGIYATRENDITPEIDLPSFADIFDNQALSGSGLGGGVYLRLGSLNLSSCSDIYSNDAIFGGGAYLITSTLTMEGDCSEIEGNIVNGDGGGVYATDSWINLLHRAELYNNQAGTDGSGSGGGAYLDQSELYSASSYIWYNTAGSYGGGVAAYNNSSVVMEINDPNCSGLRCSRLTNNQATNYYGGGVYAHTSNVSLSNTFVESNSAQYGGGVYAYGSGSAVELTSSLFDRNNAANNLGDAVRLINSASLSGGASTLANNDAGGATTGRAIDLATGASLNLSCSIIWGHASSINTTGQEVTYSDVQGGYTGEGNINQDPLFVNSGNQDFHLMVSSPAIDRCLSGSTLDFESDVRPIARNSASTPYDMGADEATTARVGVNGACAYGTIQQAVNAAPDGAEVRVSSGVYFENVDLSNKNLTIRGGYNATCTTFTGADTRVNGSLGSGSVFDISGGRVSLRNLIVEWGSDIGAGLDVSNHALVTLDATDLRYNHGSFGGGVWNDAGTVITATNGSNLILNTATSSGGGGRIWGSYVATSGADDVYNNCAVDGGAFSLQRGILSLNDADLYGNQAAGNTGKGGAIHAVDGSEVTLTSTAYIGGSGVANANYAYDGAGIYASASTVHLNGSGIVITNNQASHYGGGLYLSDASHLYGDNPRIGQDVADSGNTAQSGAGIYASSSTIEFSGRVYNNIAAVAGAGIYATQSQLNLNGAVIGAAGANQPNQLGPSGHVGAGLYLGDGTQATLENVSISNNAFQTSGYTYGGGIYITDSSVITLTNSIIQNHTAPSTTDGRGAGLYIYASRAVLDHTQVLNNVAGFNGGGIRLNNGVLTVRNASVLNSNQALSADGGAIAAVGTTTIDISNSTLQSNRAHTHGGAVYADGGTLNFTGWFDLRYNHAGGNGGAVAILGAADAYFNANGGVSYLAVNNAVGNGGAIFLGNNTTTELYAISGYQLRLNTNSAGGDGGAGYNAAGGYFDIYGNIQATSNNAAGNGGVFYLGGGARLWLDDYVMDRPQIWVNQADNGGAVYAVAGSIIECDGVDFNASPLSNEAREGSGGAFYLDASRLIADNCVFRNNTATLHGGAIAAFNSSEVEIGADFGEPTAAVEGADRTSLSPLAPDATPCNPLLVHCSSFSENIADSDANGSGYGGAIYTNNSSLRLDSTWLHQNRADRGGGIFQTGETAMGVVTNSLFYENTVSTALGGGIRAEGGSFSMQHVTLADNHGGAGYSQHNTISEARQSIAWNNEFGGFLGSFSAAACNIDQSSNAGIYADPLFVGSGNYHLQSTSPAINACTAGLPLDLENQMRPKGALYDMGVYEYPLTSLYLPLLQR